VYVPLCLTLKVCILLPYLMRSVNSCYLLARIRRLAFLMYTDRVLCEIRTEPVSVKWTSEFILQSVKIFIGFIARSMTLASISSGRRTSPLPPPNHPWGPPSLLLSWRQGFFLGHTAARPNLVQKSRIYVAVLIVLHVRARGSI
jgi:hypothetical protein